MSHISAACRVHLKLDLPSAAIVTAEAMLMLMSKMWAHEMYTFLTGLGTSSFGAKLHAKIFPIAYSWVPGDGCHMLPLLCRYFVAGRRATKEPKVLQRVHIYTCTHSFETLSERLLVSVLAVDPAQNSAVV